MQLLLAAGADVHSWFTNAISDFLGARRNKPKISPMVERAGYSARVFRIVGEGGRKGAGSGREARNLLSLFPSLSFVVRGWQHLHLGGELRDLGLEQPLLCGLGLRA